MTNQSLVNRRKIMPLCDYLTRVPGQPLSIDARPGMAYFANSGPLGATCGDCKFRGYYKQGIKRDGTEFSRPHNGCLKFKQMTGKKYGPVVLAEWGACKYFQVR